MVGDAQSFDPIRALSENVPVLGLQRSCLNEYDLTSGFAETVIKFVKNMDCY